MEMNMTAKMTVVTIVINSDEIIVNNGDIRSITKSPKRNNISYLYIAQHQ